MDPSGTFSSQGSPWAGRKVQVSAFDANDGRPKWTWALPDQVHGLEYYPVLADLDGDGRRWPCLLTSGFNQLRSQLFQLDHDGRLVRSLDFSLTQDLQNRILQERIGLGLWSHDLNADGKEELVFIAGDKVQALDGKSDKPLWECPLPDGVGEILDIHPAGQSDPAVVVVRSGNAAYGLDGPTGRLRWRCDGPGRPVTCLASNDQGTLPRVWFHTSKPQSTVCLQALPVGPDGKCLLPAAAPIDTPAEDVGLIVPLPWTNAARQGATSAVLPAMVCLGLLAYFALRRRWWITIGLLACIVVVPLAVATLQLTFWSHHYYTKFDDQHYAWSGWYWIWPYVFSACEQFAAKALVAGLFAWLLWQVVRRLLKKAKQG
jgi:hypothetical protein